jgi:hypothetical protein
VKIALLVAAVAVVTPVRAHADSTGGPCQWMQQYTMRGHEDLALAANYLDLCKADDEFATVDATLVKRLRKQIEASNLSKLDVVVTGGDFFVMVDAIDFGLPAPATMWIKPGHHEVRLVRQIDGKVFTRPIDVKPRSHVPLVLSLDEPVAKPPKDGHVTFDEPEVHDGPPPPVKHPPLLPCKYTGTCPPSGLDIADPLAPQRRVLVAADAMRMRLGLRVGVGVSTGDARAGYTIGAIGTFALASRVGAVARVDFGQRIGAMDTLGALAVGGGVAVRVATTRSVAFVVGSDLRGELRLADTFAGQRVDRLGTAADGVVDLVFRYAPFVVGARVEQAITPLAGRYGTAGLVELALELR